MKLMFNNGYCRKKEHTIQIPDCIHCKYCLYQDSKTYCIYPTNK